LLNSRKLLLRLMLVKQKRCRLYSVYLEDSNQTFAIYDWTISVRFWITSHRFEVRFREHFQMGLGLISNIRSQFLVLGSQMDKNLTGKLVG
jgi:hypothetical protein